LTRPDRPFNNKRARHSEPVFLHRCYNLFQTNVTKQFSRLQDVGTDERNVRTEYTYDVSGNRLSIRDGNATKNNTQDLTTFTYDLLGRLAGESDPLGHTTYYRHDVAGNQVAVVDANGYTTTNQYDDLGRLIGIDYPSPDADVEYQYNALGWRTAMTDGMGVTSWAYDGLGRALAITDPFTGTVGYAYDALGNRTRLTYPDNKV
jgi:YD repeat-containing protein